MVLPKQLSHLTKILVMAKFQNLSTTVLVVLCWTVGIKANSHTTLSPATESSANSSSNNASNSTETSTEMGNVSSTVVSDLTLKAFFSSLSVLKEDDQEDKEDSKSDEDQVSKEDNSVEDQEDNSSSHENSHDNSDSDEYRRDSKVVLIIPLS